MFLLGERVKVFSCIAFHGKNRKVAQPVDFVNRYSITANFWLSTNVYSCTIMWCRVAQTKCLWCTVPLIKHPTSNHAPNTWLKLNSLFCLLALSSSLEWHKNMFKSNRIKQVMYIFDHFPKPHQIFWWVFPSIVHFQEWSKICFEMRTDTNVRMHHSFFRIIAFIK